jgi:predicted TIM-barrel fold metal-dependent hydrolase
MKNAALRILSMLALASAWPVAAAPAEQYYGADDFARVDKVDAHVHVHGTATRFMAQALADNMRILTINVDYGDFPPLVDQQADAIALRSRHPGRAAFVASFPAGELLAEDWPARVLHELDAAVAAGAVGVKVWKNIGMELRDADGHYVMPDDARLEPLLNYVERSGLVLLGHQAEPLNCWLPMDQMTVRSDREYFTEHPQYYMHEHPDLPGHDQILAARDRLLVRHPQLKFDGLHLASLEWDVDRLAAFLDHFPNASADLAARLVHLEYQAARDPAKVRAFIIRYQDRLLYASDDAYGPADDDPEALAAVHGGWLSDWKFLATDLPMGTTEFAQPFHGLHLPRAVIDKLYRGNAQRLFPGAWGGTP